ncbi:MAG: extracellular solute-binding protein [Oscillospiraceae bacterium]|nr:extracellular solute-binding protein [Oscillospiraceae bacterium]
MKKLIALTLAAIMMLALCACGGENASTKVSHDIPEGKQIPDDASLDVMITSHPSWPYDANWKVWQYIKEAIGGTVNIMAIPEADFATKFSLMMTDRNEMPDVFGLGNKPAAFVDFCEQGAFLAFDDYEEEFLPDYKKFWENVSEDELWMRETRKSADGKIYYSPVYGLEKSTNIRGWLYRKDIFEKHNLKTPETMDDLYKVCKKLKELYPDSYPFCLRTAMNNINVIGSSWKEGFSYGVYYDFEEATWCYGAREDTMYDIVMFFNKMIREGLMPPDCFTIATSSWEELIATDRGFITPEYQVRIDYFNTLARPNKPGFTLTAMMPPKAEGGVNKINKYNYPPQGYAVPNTGDEGSIANAFRYINWLYTDEAIELVSWGKEGETYEIVDGKKKFILGDGSETVQSLYGINTRGTNICFDPDAIGETISKEQYEVTDFLLEHTVSDLNPTMWLALSSEESQQISDYDISLNTFVVENIQKFITGQRPMSEWKNFQKELSELPIDEMLAVYENAYNKVN